MSADELNTESINFEKDDPIESVNIVVAHPDSIINWSSGEIKNPETINYRTPNLSWKVLFCQRIFGPVRDYECACSHYKRIKYKGQICDRCGVEGNSFRVRRERMGHIDLAVPCTLCWFLKSMPSRLGLILDMTAKNLERVIYYENYMVTDPGKTPSKSTSCLSEGDIFKHLMSMVMMLLWLRWVQMPY